MLNRLNTRTKENILIFPYNVAQEKNHHSFALDNEVKHEWKLA